MQRLASVLDEEDRVRLARHLAATVIDAGRRAGLTTTVATADPVVEAWGRASGCAIIPDRGLGLNVAASDAIATVGDGPWILAHADLPLASASAFLDVLAAMGSHVVLVPSADGGTSVIAGTGPRFSFSFGPSSFHRHLARHPDAIVLPSAALSIDIDTPTHLAAFPWLDVGV